MKIHCSKKIVQLIKLLLTAIIFVLVFYKFDINISAIILQIRCPGYILLALLVPLVVMPIISSNRWKLFLKEVGINESVFYLIKTNWISVFQGLLLPSSQGQDFLRIYYIEKRHPEHRGVAGSTIIIERMIGFAILIIIGCLSSFIIDIPNKWQVVSTIGVILLLYILLVVLILSKKIHTFIFKLKIKNKFINKLYNYCEIFSGAITTFPYKNILLSSVFLILIFQIATISCVYLIFKGYGYDIPFHVHMALYPIISILSMLPITISGLGIREGFFAFYYSQLGIPSDIAVSVSLMNYMLVVLLPAILGAILYMIDTLIVAKK